MRERTELILPTKMKHGNQQEIVSSESKAERIHKTGIEPKEQLGKTKTESKQSVITGKERHWQIQE